MKNVCGDISRTASTVSVRVTTSASAVKVTTVNTHVTTQGTAHQPTVTETVPVGLRGRVV